MDKKREEGVELKRSKIRLRRIRRWEVEVGEERRRRRI